MKHAHIIRLNFEKIQKKIERSFEFVKYIFSYLTTTVNAIITIIDVRVIITACGAVREDPTSCLYARCRFAVNLARVFSCWTGNSVEIWNSSKPSIKWVPRSIFTLIQRVLTIRSDLLNTVADHFLIKLFRAVANLIREFQNRNFRNGEALPGSTSFKLFVEAVAFFTRPVVETGSRKYFQPNASLLQSTRLAVETTRLAFTWAAPVGPKRLLLNKTDAVCVEKRWFLDQTAELLGVNDVRSFSAFYRSKNLLRVDGRVVVDCFDFWRANATSTPLQMNFE